MGKTKQCPGHRFDAGACTLAGCVLGHEDCTKTFPAETRAKKAGDPDALARECRKLHDLDLHRSAALYASLHEAVGTDDRETPGHAGDDRA